MSLVEIANNIKLNETYMIDLYNINTIIHVVCINIAINACDLKIIYMEKNNKIVTEYNNYIISYNYEWNLKKIHFRSFSYFDNCRIYKIVLSQ